MKNTRKSPTPARALQEERQAFRTGLARLVENELEKAEVVLAFKTIVDDFQDIAEKLVKIEAEDLMPNLDALKASYGPSVADRFYQTITAKLRGAIETIQSTRSAISTEVLKLENVVNGEPGNDMALDDGGLDPAPEDDAAATDLPPDGAAGTDAGVPPAGDLPPGDEEPEIDLGDEDEEDPVFGDRGVPAAGRARKESVAPKGRRLPESARLKEREQPPLSDAQVAHAKQQIVRHQDLNDHHVDMTNRHRAEFKKTGNAAHDQAAKLHKEAIPLHARAVSAWENHHPEVKARAAAAMTATQNADAASRSLGLHESRNLDPLILKAFRQSLAEGKSPIQAARRVAERFAVDLPDVIEVVKEAKAKARKKPDTCCGKGAPAKKPWEKDATDAKGKVAETRRAAPRQR